METAKAVAAFLTSRRAKNVMPTTLSNYRWALRFLADLPDLPTDPYEVELVLAEATSHLGEESMFTLYRRLRDFLEWTSTRYQVSNPFLRPNPFGSKPQLLITAPVRPEKLPKILTSSQVQHILHSGCRSARER